MVNRLIFGLDGCKAYIDDAIIYSEEWEQHLEIIRKFFKRLSDAKLTINLPKREFCHANLTFLGHIVGQGQVRPVEAKVEAISDFPVPTGKRQLMRFLGMAGYYRKFCNNFSAIAEPLTNYLVRRSSTRVVRKVLRLCLYLKVICMLYNKIHTDEQINVLCGTVEKNRVEKMNIVGDIRLQGNQCRASRSTLNLTFSKYLRQQNK